MGFMGSREEILASVKKYLDTLPVIMALDGACTLGADSRYYKETKAHDVRKYLVKHILAQVPNRLTYYGYEWVDYKDIAKHLDTFDLEMDINHFVLGPETLPLGSLVGTASEIKSAFIKIVMERIHNEIAQVS